MQKNKKLIIYLDGSCHICHHDAKLILKADENHVIEIENIAGPAFKTQDIPLDKLYRALHVKTTTGDILFGIDAIIEICRVLPKYRWLAKIFSLPTLYPIAKIGYLGFARFRMVLPKRKSNSCEYRSKI